MEPVVAICIIMIRSGNCCSAMYVITSGNCSRAMYIITSENCCSIMYIITRGNCSSGMYIITSENCHSASHCPCMAHLAAIYNDVKNFSHSIIPAEIVSVREWRVCTLRA